MKFLAAEAPETEEELIKGSRRERVCVKGVCEASRVVCLNKTDVRKWKCLSPRICDMTLASPRQRQGCCHFSSTVGTVKKEGKGFFRKSNRTLPTHPSEAHMTSASPSKHASEILCNWQKRLQSAFIHTAHLIWGSQTPGPNQNLLESFVKARLLDSAASVSDLGVCNLSWGLGICLSTCSQVLLLGVREHTFRATGATTEPGLRNQHDVVYFLTLLPGHFIPCASVVTETRALPAQATVNCTALRSMSASESHLTWQLGLGKIHLVYEWEHHIRGNQMSQKHTQKEDGHIFLRKVCSPGKKAKTVGRCMGQDFSTKVEPFPSLSSCPGIFNDNCIQFCWLRIWVWRQLRWASSGQSPGMLLNVLQYTCQPLTAKDYGT